jgi:hypothetical protein
VCQSAAITKAGARPANRKAVAVSAICSIRNLSHQALDRGSEAGLLAGTPIPGERSSALVVRAPSPPVRLPSLCSLLIPGSNVWGMACRSCNSVTVRDGAQGPPLVVNGSTRAAAPKPPSLFLRTFGRTDWKNRTRGSVRPRSALKIDDHGNGRQDSFCRNSK